MTPEKGKQAFKESLYAIAIVSGIIFVIAFIGASIFT